MIITKFKNLKSSFALKNELQIITNTANTNVFLENPFENRKMLPKSVIDFRATKRRFSFH